MISKIKIYLIGKWTGHFIDKVNSYKLEKEIEWVKYLPHSQALSLCNQMDAMALAVEEHLEGRENVTPGRIYEYLNLKKPILAMCPTKSDLAYLINYCQAGEVVSYNDLESLKIVLKEWIKNKNNLQQKYDFKNLTEFERKNLTSKMIRLIDDFLC